MHFYDREYPRLQAIRDRLYGCCIFVALRYVGFRVRFLIDDELIAGAGRVAASNVRGVTNISDALLTFEQKGIALINSMQNGDLFNTFSRSLLLNKSLAFVLLFCFRHHLSGKSLR